MPRWAVWVLIAIAAGLILSPRIWPASTATKVTYTEFLALVQSGKVNNVEINNLNNTISGVMDDGSEFVTTGATVLSAPQGWHGRRRNHIIAVDHACIEWRVCGRR